MRQRDSLRYGVVTVSGEGANDLLSRLLAVDNRQLKTASHGKGVGRNLPALSIIAAPLSHSCIICLLMTFLSHLMSFQVFFHVFRT